MTITVTPHAIDRLRERFPEYQHAEYGACYRQIAALVLDGYPFGHAYKDFTMVGGPDGMVFGCRDSPGERTVVTVLTQDQAIANTQMSRRSGGKRADRRRRVCRQY